MSQAIIDALRAKEAALREQREKSLASIEASRAAIPPHRRTAILFFIGGSSCLAAGAVAWAFGASPFVLLPAALCFGAYAVLRAKR